MTRLLDGRVLVTGGVGVDGRGLDTAEIFDPATRKFTRSLVADVLGRAGATWRCCCNSGDVLVAGGVDGERATASGAARCSASRRGRSRRSAPRCGWARAGPARGRRCCRAAGCSIAGGRGTAGPLATVEIYDPALGGFAVTDVGERHGPRPRGPDA